MRWQIVAEIKLAAIRRQVSGAHPVIEENDKLSRHAVKHAITLSGEKQKNSDDIQ